MDPWNALPWPFKYKCIEIQHLMTVATISVRGRLPRTISKPQLRQGHSVVPSLVTEQNIHGYKLWIHFTTQIRHNIFNCQLQNYRFLSQTESIRVRENPFRKFTPHTDIHVCTHTDLYTHIIYHTHIIHTDIYIYIIHTQNHIPYTHTHIHTHLYRHAVKQHPATFSEWEYPLQIG